MVAAPPGLAYIGDVPCAVLPDGSVLVASEKQNVDLLWAVRGAGPGFFGVVTEFSLRVYPAPIDVDLASGGDAAVGGLAWLG